MLKMKKTKKWLAVLLTAIMLLCLLPMVSFAQEDTQGSIVWSFDEETATLTVGGEGAIPGYGVSNSGFFDPPPWWKFLTKADKIVIEEGITEIGTYNFAFSTAKEVVFPDSLKKIDAAAFMEDIGLKEIILPEGLKTVGEMAFSNCVMVEKVYIPESVEEFDENFYSYLASWKVRELVFLPTTAQCYVYQFSGFADYAYADAYAYYQQCEIDARDVNVIDDDKADEVVYLKTAAYCNDKLHTSFPMEYSEANMDSLDSFFYKNVEYSAPAWSSFVCKNESAQHEMFRTMGRIHKLFETGEVCNCFPTTGTYGENITWSLDVNTGTLTFDGTGAMPEEYPDYGNLAGLIKNIRFAEGSSITEISTSALGDIYGADIVIPASVERINDSTLFKEYTSVTVDDGNDVYFDADGVVYEKNDGGITLIYCPTDKTGEFTVPEYVTAIVEEAFGYSSLEKITIPETVKFFGGNMFEFCNADVYVYDSADAEVNRNILLDFCGTIHCRPDSKLCDQFDYFREFNVEMIEEKDIDHIEIETLPDKTVYTYRETGGADLTGLTVRVFFTDGTSAVRSACYAREDDFSTWKIGKTTLPVCYGRYETAIDVTVSPIEYTDINIGESKTETNTTNSNYYLYFRFVPQVTAEYQFNYSSDDYDGVYSEIFDQNMERFASNGYDQSSMSEILYAGETYYISMFVRSDDTCTISIDENYHPASEWIVDKEPTCITVGSKHKECLDCGKTIVTEDLLVDPDANGELSDWIVDADATCTAVGKKHKECTDCHEILERSDIDRIGHTPVVVPGKAATCEQSGLTDGSICLVCGETLTAQETIPEEGHTDSDNDGNCDNCGKKLRELSVIEKITAFFRKILDFFRNLLK